MPLTDDTLMTRPHLRSTMPSMTCFGHVEDAVEVGVMTASQSALVMRFEGHVAGDAGVVDQHIDGADVGVMVLDAGLAGVEISDVAGIGLEAVAHVVHGLQPFGRLGVARRMGGDHLVTRALPA